MIRFLTLFFLFQLTLFGCQNNNDSQINDLVENKNHFSIFKYEINSIKNLFLERYGFIEADNEVKEIKKLLIDELYNQDMDYIFNIIFPTPEFTVGNSPKLLVTSPRNKIERQSELLINSKIDLNSIEKIEKKIKDEENLSSVVIDIGGIAAYPAIVKESNNPKKLFLTFGHEWLHQYLIFYPLGRSYFSDIKMKEINETLANIFSEKLLISLCLKEFELKEAICSIKYKEKNEFDYSNFMKNLREDVDNFLLQKKILAAEELMKNATLELNNNGYNIRKINQAWFAFNGTYADSPSSTSNVDDELLKFIDSQPSLKEAIDKLRNIKSLKDYYKLIKDSAETKK
ncbi:MAG: hypothetical protein ACJ0GV_02715 [Dehalococcoidia bacterium]|nr:hypothetical protein [Chloroflexota bacterium]